jgi:hypothetical protein
MKLLMIATALLVLSGCERAVEVELQSREKPVTKPAEFNEEYISTDTSGLYLITDNVTGCQYFYPIGSGRSATPRMNADGTQYCRKDQVTP